MMKACVCSFRLWLLVASVLLLLAPVASAVVNIDWVTVGDPGNAADDIDFGFVAFVQSVVILGT